MVRTLISVTLMGMAMMGQFIQPVFAKKTCYCEIPNTTACTNAATNNACDAAGGDIVFGSSSNAGCDTCVVGNDATKFFQRCSDDGAGTSCSAPSKVKRTQKKRACADGTICQCFDLNHNLLKAGTYDACSALPRGNYFDVNGPQCWGAPDDFASDFQLSCERLAVTNTAECHAGQAPAC